MNIDDTQTEFFLQGATAGTFNEWLEGVKKSSTQQATVPVVIRQGTVAASRGDKERFQTFLFLGNEGSDVDGHLDVVERGLPRLEGFALRAKGLLSFHFSDPKFALANFRLSQIPGTPALDLPDIVLRALITLTTANLKVDFV